MVDSEWCAARVKPVSELVEGLIDFIGVVILLAWEELDTFGARTLNPYLHLNRS